MPDPACQTDPEVLHALEHCRDDCPFDESLANDDCPFTYQVCRNYTQCHTNSITVDLMPPLHTQCHTK